MRSACAACARKVEIAMLPDDVRVVLQLDGLAEWETVLNHQEEEQQ
jgi:hypothetical protein